MNQELIDRIKTNIDIEGTSYFIYNDRFINIFTTAQGESEIAPGDLCYMYNIFPIEYIKQEVELAGESFYISDELSHTYQLIDYIEDLSIQSYDGGLCTGTIEDAIEMALQQY